MATEKKTSKQIVKTDGISLLSPIKAKEYGYVIWLAVVAAIVMSLFFVLRVDSDSGSLAALAFVFTPLVAAISFYLAFTLGWTLVYLYRIFTNKEKPTLTGLIVLVVLLALPLAVYFGIMTTNY